MSPSLPLPFSLPLTQMPAKRSVHKGLCRDYTTYVMAVHQTPGISRRRPHVADTIGMAWEKNKCRQTRHFLGSFVTFKQSQDIASGIPKF
jgi:hypothetical protein